MPVLQLRCNHYLVALSLLVSCWRTLLFLLENKYLSEDSDSSSWSMRNKRLDLTLKLTQRLEFLCKRSAQNLFVDPFTVIQQAGQVTETPCSNPCPDLVSRCLKQVKQIQQHSVRKTLHQNTVCSV